MNRRRSHCLRRQCDSLRVDDDPIGDWSLFRPAGFFQAFKQAFLNRRCWNLTHIALDQDLSIGASVRRSTANLGLKVNPEFYIDRSNSL